MREWEGEIELSADQGAPHGGDRQQECLHGQRTDLLQHHIASRYREDRGKREGAVFVLPRNAERAVADGDKQHDEREEILVDISVQPSAR